MAKEIVNEIKLQHEMDFHENIIRFYGITTTENQSDNSKKYLLVLEYADSGTLRSYLNERFEELSWNDKLDLAFQLTNAISYLHDQEIVHRDLNSNDILVHKNTIKLSDFGLRETPIPNTPDDYVMTYTDCWNDKPENRPTINQNLQFHQI
ncbi:unnamed protein product [Rhizophagus irregularis]|nr:unnamed protein product [Rhizophagus irregularis]